MSGRLDNIRVERIPEPPPGEMRRFDLVTLSIGTVLGTGLLTFLPTGVAQMGTSAVIGFPVAVILGFLYLLPVTIACSILRMSGGLISLVGDVCSPLMTGLYGLGSCLPGIALAMYGVTFASYAAQVFPDINQTFWAMVVLTAFYLINLAGIKAMSRLQNVMTVALACGLALFIIIGCTQVTQPIFDFSNPNFMPNDVATTLTGFMVLFGCCNTFQSVSAAGRIAKRATKDIPFAFAITSVFIFFLYFFCAVVAAGVLPYEEISDSGTLVPILRAIFPNWLFAIWMVAIPGLLVFTTMNGLFPTYAEMLAQCARDGWLPASWGKTSKRDVSVIPLTIYFVAAAAFTLTGLSPAEIILCTNILTIPFDIILMVAMLRLPKKYPEQWKKSKWALPFGLWAVLNIIRVALRGAAAYSSVIALDLQTVALTIAIVVVCIGWCLYRGRRANAVIRVSAWPAHMEESKEA